jgi:hypothetical protein
MAEALATDFILEGEEAVIDPEKVTRILGHLYLSCHEEFPGGACFADYTEEVDIATYPRIYSRGTFICVSSRSEGCAQRNVDAAHEAENFHRSNSPEGVRVSINGALK